MSSNSLSNSELPSPSPPSSPRHGPLGSGPSAAGAAAWGPGHGDSSSSQPSSSSSSSSSDDSDANSSEESQRSGSEESSSGSESEEDYSSDAEHAGGDGSGVAGGSHPLLARAAAEEEDGGLAWQQDGGAGSYSSEDEPENGRRSGGLAAMLQLGSDEEGGEGSGGMLQQLRLLMAMRGAGPPRLPVQRPPLLPSFDLQGVAELIRSGRARRIICMCGAGISVSAGIPDFRSPGTGLYHRLEHYGLPHPEAVFELEYFKSNPRPFFLLAKELFPGVWRPTPAHYFMRLLHARGLLLRCYTQNIDSLEHQAGLPRSAVVAAHGNFDSARCIRCGRRHSVEYVRRAVFAGEGHPCFCKRKRCGGLVKPDIVFFGEPLPRRFFESVPQDFPQADLLLVMGSSLVVHPFASLIDEVEDDTPRLLINRERVGEAHPLLRMLGYQSGGFCFDAEAGSYRDAFFQGDCDEGVRQLCRLLGWEGELDALIAAGPCPSSPDASEAGSSSLEASSESESEEDDKEAQLHRRRLSRAQRRRQLRVAVGSMLALPGRRARRLLQIRLLHAHARQQRRLVQQMRRLRLQGGGA